MQEVIRVAAAYQNHNYGEVGNPLTECLPPNIPREEDLIAEFTYIPELPTNFDLLNIEERLDLVNLIEDIRIPILSQINCARQIQSMIRTAYKGRNPLKNEDILRCIDRLDQKEVITSANYMSKVQRKPVITTKRTKTFLGISGAGKTTTALTACGMYPQVIKHQNYNNSTFFKDQIVYLHVECPFSGDPKSFVNNIIDAIDKVLDNDHHYSSLYREMNLNDKIIAIGNLIDIHAIGILMIDEIQNLTNKTEGKKLHSQITMMINTWKIPILFIGTPLACELFNSEFRSNRRMGDTSMRLEKLNESKLEDGEDYDSFLNELWNFQVTKNFTVLTNNISKIFYEKTQGIVDIMKLLFERIQSYLIRDPLNQDEFITEEVIQKVYHEEFKSIKEALEAIRSGDIREIEKFGDLTFDLKQDLLEKSVFETGSGVYANLRKDRSNQKRNLKVIICDSLLNSDNFKTLTKAEIRKIAKDIVNRVSDQELQHPEDIIGKAYIRAYERTDQKKKEKTQAREVISNSPLPILNTHNEKIKKKVTAYSLLKRKGFIADYNEFS